MSNQREGWGRRAATAVSPAAMLALEEADGHGERFAAIDALVAQTVHGMLQGERVVELTAHQGSAVRLLGLGSGHRQALETGFAVERQQAKGAWFLPEESSLPVGLINLPHHYRQQPRFAMTAVAEERGKVAFAGSPDALFLWAVLEPLCEGLFRPFQLRGPQAGTKDRGWQRGEWARVDEFLEALGVGRGSELAAMRFGSGWSALRAAQQLQTKQRFLAALAREVPATLTARFRAQRLLRLLDRYYAKAGKGPPTKRQVLTREFQRTLSAIFGGDWLAFLDHIGELPHPEERITTALPVPRLFATDHTRVADIAAGQGLPIDEVERILAAFWGEETQPASPVALRTAALAAYWQRLDAVHASQRSGMRPLWGLVEEGTAILAEAYNPTQPHQPGLYRELLPPSLLAQIDELWSGMLLPRHPGRIVSAPLPHALMAEALGPALKFWHGCGLTAWFICEGPMSRTDLPGLANYYHAELAALDQAGFPVDPALFRDLIHAESRLGAWEPIPGERSDVVLGGDFEMAITFSIGRRRAGFEFLRDIITRHRQVWTARYFDAYAQHRWRSEVVEAARQYNLLLENKGRTPTVKQFSQHAAAATNHWFGGNISALYRMIGEKAPAEPQTIQLLPADRYAFVSRVFAKLETHAGVRGKGARHQSTSQDQAERERARWDLRRFAEGSLRYVQVEEALEQAPTIDEFGRHHVERAMPHLAATVEAAWEIFHLAIEDALLPQPSVAVEIPAPGTGVVAAWQEWPDAAAPLMAQDVRPLGATAAPRPLWKRLFGKT